MRLFDVFADKVGLSGYVRDKKLARSYGGFAVSREDYETYKETQGSLKKAFVGSKHIYRKYYGFGTPSQQSSYNVTNDMLAHLKQGGVVLDLTKEENKGALNALTYAISSFASNNGIIPQPVEPYNEIPKFKEWADKWEETLIQRGLR